MQEKESMRRPHLFPPSVRIALGLLCVAAGTAGALEDKSIEAHTLDNGMKVVLWPDHSIPNVALYTFFRVGSRNERPGITGLSHFFEHMMFLGSKNYPPGEFDHVMEAAGGRNNAFTERDITVYQDWFPRSALPTIFELESDRIAHLSIDSTSVQSERGVVASERRRSVEDDNVESLDEQTWAAAFMAHPYQWPVIGWMVDIEHWKIRDLYDYFHTYYAPNNATLVAVGDFEPSEFLGLCRKYLEPISRGPQPPAVTTVEPEQKGERRIELHRQAQVATLSASWHIPATSSPDYFVLRVLETLLLQGDSSRLHQRLVEKDQLALRVFGGMGYALDPTLFQVYVQPLQGVEPAACEKAVDSEIERLRTTPTDEHELRKAKNQIAADFYRELQTISGKASVLGFSDVYFGDPKFLLGAVPKFEAVTAADVQRVVGTWFQNDNRTMGVLVPENAAASTPAGEAKEGAK
jgi:zinc protease